jgi:hypothetical protein
MGTQIGVGVSHHRNPAMAGKEAVAQAMQQAGLTLDLAADRPDFVMLFATVGYRQSVLLQSVRAATHQAPLIGCSGAGVIAQGIADESNFAVTVLLIKSDEMRFTYGIETGIKASSAKVGEAVGEAISRPVASSFQNNQDAPNSQNAENAQNETPAEAKALFLFLEGVSPNFDEFMEGLRSRTNLEKTIPAIGGFSGDDVAIRETFQYCDDHITTDGAVWALLSGAVKVASVMSHGCVPIGEKHTVTKSDRNAVFEIDHKPALEVLQSYLTQAEIDDWSIAPVMLGWAFESAHSLAAEAVAAEREDKLDATMIRAMAARNEQAGAVYMMSDIVEGSDFRIARRDREKICDKADKMADALLAQLNSELGEPVAPKLIFHVECVGRGKLIFREPEKLSLINHLQAKIGPKIPWIGFYAFAEIGPVLEQNCVHNFTSILTALY